LAIQSYFVELAGRGLIAELLFHSYYPDQGRFSRGKIPSDWYQSRASMSEDQLVEFTANVEELSAELLQAVGYDRYSPAEVIQAACNLIAAAITKTRDKELAIQATRRWIVTSLERARSIDSVPYRH
jgi:hypothetical protein